MRMLLTSGRISSHCMNARTAARIARSVASPAACGAAVMTEPAASSGFAWPAALCSSQDLHSKVRAAKVLCIGAGGIGCELLKTLVCSGFENIELVDLDTIETSNLNRQFLFRKQHVGQSKAKVAAESIKAIRPNATIVAHHANIKESRFNIDFFKGFDLVLNGLDNLDARRHVNRLCMAAKTPLIESGTAGYVGQVTVHFKGSTQCFECEPKAVPKSFPICTLRNTPDRPIHCIVWSKDLLFTRLFGKADAVTDLDEGSGKEKEAKEGGAEDGEGTAGDAEKEAEREAERQQAEEASFFVRRPDEEPLAYAERIFDRVYRDDISRLATMEDLWKKRAPPKPQPPLRQLLPDLDAELGAALKAAQGGGGAAAAVGVSACKALGLKNPNAKWDAADNARVFVTAVVAFLTLRGSEVGSAAFDKDDDLAVEFVTAASNLRSLCYDIPVQSLFDAKGMAGNIIHAIATTNAIISGLIVIEALKVLAGAQSQARNTYVSNDVVPKVVLIAANPEKPVAACMTCGQAQLQLRVNTNAMTLGDLLSTVVKKRLAVSVPMLQCGDFLYEEGEGLDDDEVEMYQGLLKRVLSALPDGGLRDGSILSVKDELQHFNLQLLISHQDEFDEEKEPEGYVLEGTVPVATAAPPAPAAEAATDAAAAQAGTSKEAAVVPEEDDDGFEMFDEPPPAAAPSTAAAVGAGATGVGAAAADGKRKRSGAAEEGEAGGQGGGAKKARVEGAGGGGGDADDDVIVL